MKIPVKCPICGDVMMTRFERIMYKICSTHINHGIQFISNDDCFTVRQVILRVSTSPFIYAKWIFNAEIIRIETEGTLNNIILPWFEPDLSNYKKLLEKIKTYILLS
ncbi:MAG TPA: hypothetical protein VII94_04195 [Candidatus Saccharimonadales bacterium]